MGVQVVSCKYEQVELEGLNKKEHERSLEQMLAL